VPDDKRDLFKSKYSVVTTLKHTFRSKPTDVDMAKTFAATLRDGSTSFVMMPEHIVKRCLMLTTTTLRAGPDKGLACLTFYHHEGLATIGVFVLKSWLLECAFNNEWSVKAMLERAAYSNRFTRPGRYLVPAPLLLQDAAEEVLSSATSVELAANFDALRGSYVPHLMSYFDVGVHERTCGIYDAAVERKSVSTNWNFQTTRAVPTGCTCFRSTATVAGCTFANDKLYKQDPENVAGALFSHRHAGVRAYAARCNPEDKRHHRAAGAALRTYPLHGIEEAERVNGGERRRFSSLSADAVRALEQQAQWAALCRTTETWCPETTPVEEAALRMQELATE
jgi:hypothetical protein